MDRPASPIVPLTGKALAVTVRQYLAVAFAPLAGVASFFVTLGVLTWL